MNIFSRLPCKICSEERRWFRRHKCAERITDDPIYKNRGLYVPDAPLVGPTSYYVGNYGKTAPFRRRLNPNPDIDDILGDLLAMELVLQTNPPAYDDAPFSGSGGAFGGGGASATFDSGSSPSYDSGSCSSGDSSSYDSSSSCDSGSSSSSGD